MGVEGGEDGSTGTLMGSRVRDVTGSEKHIGEEGNWR
jgi:hypothetical protein